MSLKHMYLQRVQLCIYFSYALRNIVSRSQVDKIKLRITRPYDDNVKLSPSKGRGRQDYDVHYIFNMCLKSVVYMLKAYSRGSILR